MKFNLILSILGALLLLETVALAPLQAPQFYESPISPLREDTLVIPSTEAISVASFTEAITAPPTSIENLSTPDDPTIRILNRGSTSRDNDFMSDAELETLLSQVQSEIGNSVAWNAANYVSDDLDLEEILQLIQNQSLVTEATITGVVNGEGNAPTLNRQPSRPEIPECPICYEPLRDSEADITSCNHKFHHRCLISWLRNGDSCPLCRKYIRREHSVV